ncbi:MAG: hypothetical protein QOF94_2532 [Acidobacteriaceae bacterium]|jgi:hypothetical protein|nr:hypothetical protein [Acidobacteriaceae bacterium]
MLTTSPLGKNNEAARSYRLSAVSSTLPTRGQIMTIQLTHFSAAFVFALFASVVFGITHRETTRDMVRYGLYCFAMFLGGVLVAGWAMWLVRR